MLFALISLALDRVPPEFDRFLAKPDRSYSWRELAGLRGSRQIELTSQTWQGAAWKHTILFRQPKDLAAKGTAILFITGDGPKEGDYNMLGLVTAATAMPTAMLHNIPNQPIYGMKEDDLIAHTFEKFLATGDASWPLLFPMAKSAVRAMDAIVALTAESDNPIKRFVVTGASKRGWTTWFVGAANDSRVIGIAPMVYDNLNLRAQMPHQLKQWGAYSEQIQDYTRRGLQQKLTSAAGAHLAEVVDPFTYRSRIKVPTMIVNGGNDPYWAVDALSLYWNDLRQPHWCSIVPNAGHSLGNGLQAIGTIGAFARSLAGEFAMPTYSVSFSKPHDPSVPKGAVSFTRPGLFDQEVVAKVTLNNAVPSRVDVLVNEVPNTDFRPGTWKSIANVSPTAKGTVSIPFRIPNSLNAAVIVQFTFRHNGRDFVTSWPAKVFPKKG